MHVLFVNTPKSNRNEKKAELKQNLSQSSGTSSLAGALDKSLELGSDQLDNIQEDQDMPDAETRNDPPSIVEPSTSSSKRTKEDLFHRKIL